MAKGRRGGRREKKQDNEILTQIMTEAELKKSHFCGRNYISILELGGIINKIKNRGSKKKDGKES